MSETDVLLSVLAVLAILAAPISVLAFCWKDDVRQAVDSARQDASQDRIYREWLVDARLHEIANRRNRRSIIPSAVGFVSALGAAWYLLRRGSRL